MGKIEWEDEDTGILDIISGILNPVKIKILNIGTVVVNTEGSEASDFVAYAVGGSVLVLLFGLFLWVLGVMSGINQLESSGVFIFGIGFVVMVVVYQLQDD